VSVRINTNADANEVQRNVQLALQRFSTAVERLSTGIRINSASDDAAGLAISEELITQIKGFDQAERNALDAVSLAQTGESALSTTSQILQRMRQLAVEAANDTYTTSDRQDLQKEVEHLISEIDRIAQQTDFNTKKLLDGSAGGATVAGGGDIIDSIQAQSGVTIDGKFTIPQAQNALRSAAESVSTPQGSLFMQNSSITIQGGRGTATFNAHPGETLEEFFQQVENSGIGVTMGFDLHLNNGNPASSPPVMIANKEWGSNDPIVGSPDGPNSVNVLSATGDFADTGLQMGFFVGGNNFSYQFAMDSSGVQRSLIADNAEIQINDPNGDSQVLIASGPKGDTFTGGGSSAGLTISVSDPGNLTTTPFAFVAPAGNNSFSVAQHGALQFHVGANAYQTVAMSLDSATSLALGVSATNLRTRDDAQEAITHLDRAIERVAAIRALIGATINRLSNTVANDSSADIQASASNSRIRDVDVARETVDLVATQIHIGGGIAVLAQANQTSRSLLRLLR